MLPLAPESETFPQVDDAGVGDIGYFVSQDQVDRALKQNYLDFTTMLDTKFEVSAGSDGSLYINGEHEDRAAIEKILNTTPGVKEAFLQMPVNTSQAV